MFFTRRNAQDLDEIKALAHEQREQVVDALERLGRIDELRRQRLTARDGRRALVAFVHIPKTAGGTATTMLANAFSSAGVHGAGNYMRGPEATERKLARREGGWEEWLDGGGRASVGHVPYRVFRRYLPPETRYMTFLREPVDRVLSHYYRHIHHPEGTAESRRERREGRKERAGSIEEALTELRLPQIRNLMTRFLCGHPTREEDLAASALTSAKANLRNFAFVGIQERFDESIILLQRWLGLDRVPYLNRHVSEDRPRVEDIPAEQRELIAEHNHLDAELYRFGLELFEEALAAWGRDLTDDVEELRAVSTDANAEAIQRARDWLDRELPPGATRPAEKLRAEAKAAGVKVLALRQVLKELDMRAARDGDGTRMLTRVAPGEEPAPGEPPPAPLSPTTSPGA
jgi:hypothetical protein